MTKDGGENAMSKKLETTAMEVARGLVVGLCATQALDWVSILLYDNEDPAIRRAEDRTRGNHHAYEVAVARLAARAGRELTEEEIATWGWRFHKVFGVLGGISYLALRRRFPVLRWGCGLVFGMAFFVLGDEVLVPATGLTPGPRAFTWPVHARGAAAHLAYGVAAEGAARLME
jgi:hypothetical protein